MIEFSRGNNGRNFFFFCAVDGETKGVNPLWTLNGDDVIFMVFDDD